MNDAMLRDFREACFAVAARDPDSNPAAPLAGLCSTVAMIVKGIAGGDVVRGRIDTPDGPVPHFWNRLPDGREVDLTSCQFGGDGFTPLKRGRKVPSDFSFFPAVCFAVQVQRHLQAGSI